MRSIAHAIVVGTLFFGSVAFAQQDKGGPPRPPPEALDACKGKSAGDSCTFNHGDTTLQGTCFTPASDKPLACRPADAPR